MTFPLPGANWSYLHGLTLKASTLAAGYTLVNGTGDILTWTAPDDGNLHRAMILNMLKVTGAETGGQVQAHWTDPGGGAQAAQFFAPNTGAGLVRQGNLTVFLQAGTTLTLSQDSALTAGASVLWAELWGS